MIRNTLAFASKDLLIVLRDKGVLAVYFLMPLLFASLLGLAFGNVGGEEKTIEIEILLRGCLRYRTRFRFLHLRLYRQQILILLFAFILYARVLLNDDYFARFRPDRLSSLQV